MVFNTTFNNISAILWRSVILVEETEEPKKTTDLSQVTDKRVSTAGGENTFAHIPDRRLHDCAQFTCILVLRLRTLPFQYTMYLHNLLHLLTLNILYFK